MQASIQVQSRLFPSYGAQAVGCEAQCWPVVFCECIHLCPVRVQCFHARCGGGGTGRRSRARPADLTYRSLHATRCSYHRVYPRIRNAKDKYNTCAIIRQELTVTQTLTLMHFYLYFNFGHRLRGYVYYVRLNLSNIINRTVRFLLSKLICFNKDYVHIFYFL